MKGILLLNGEPYEGEISTQDAYVVCCDGAYAWANGKVRIDENVGDYDSLPYFPSPSPKEIFPKEKDYTDGEIGLRKLIDHGCNPIEIYGGGGGREDHFIGNLHLLYYATQQKVSTTMLTKNAEIFVVDKRVEITNAIGKTISLFPFGDDAHIVESKGLKYPLKDTMLFCGYCRGISNVITAKKASFSCDRGCVLVFLNQE